MAPTTTDTIGARLAHLRQGRGWTLDDLAARTGIRAQNLSRLENDHRLQVRSDTLVRLALALGCTTDYLLGLCDTPTGPHRTAR